MVKTYKILFICHGNICRSPMAECIMAELLKDANIENVMVASAATSSEETGNDIHPGSQAQLKAASIPRRPHSAHRMTTKEADEANLIIGMDRANMINLRRMVPKEQYNKLHMLLEYTGENRDVDDPWYTGEYSVAFQDILNGCKALLKKLRQEGTI